MAKKIVMLTAVLLLLTGCGKSDPGTADDSSDVIVTVESTDETSETETETDTTDPAEAEDTNEEETESTSEEASEEKTTEKVSEAYVPDTAQGSTDGLNVLTALKTGLSMDETFAVTGSGYDSSEPTYKGGECYTWLLDKENAFGTGLAGNMFVEFDKNKELICFGYHLGGIEGSERTVYPYSPEELENAFNTIYSQLLSQHGEPDRVDTLRNDIGSDYVKGEKEWLFENNDGLWLMYGINLWADNEPANYEDGINEIIVSMSAPQDYNY